MTESFILKKLQRRLFQNGDLDNIIIFFGHLADWPHPFKNNYFHQPVIRLTSLPRAWEATVWPHPFKNIFVISSSVRPHPYKNFRQPRIRLTASVQKYFHPCIRLAIICFERFGYPFLILVLAVRSLARSFISEERFRVRGHKCFEKKIHAAQKFPILSITLLMVCPLAKRH